MPLDPAPAILFGAFGLLPPLRSPPRLLLASRAIALFFHAFAVAALYEVVEVGVDVLALDVDVVRQGRSDRSLVYHLNLEAKAVMALIISSRVGTSSVYL
jgi:hypothetical protein